MEVIEGHSIVELSRREGPGLSALFRFSFSRPTFATFDCLGSHWVTVRLHQCANKFGEPSGYRHCNESDLWTEDSHTSEPTKGDVALSWVNLRRGAAMLRAEFLHTDLKDLAQKPPYPTKWHYANRHGPVSRINHRTDDEIPIKLTRVGSGRAA